VDISGCQVRGEYRPLVCAYVCRMASSIQVFEQLKGVRFEFRGVTED